MTEEELQSKFESVKKKKDQFTIKQFTSSDKYTMQVMHLHTLALQQKVLTVLH
jgi:hypothetical protein